MLVQLAKLLKNRNVIVELQHKRNYVALALKTLVKAKREFTLVALFVKGVQHYYFSSYLFQILNLLSGI